MIVILIIDDGVTFNNLSDSEVSSDTADSPSNDASDIPEEGNFINKKNYIADTNLT